MPATPARAPQATKSHGSPVGTATPDAGADGTASSSAACACADGATARATFVPDGQGGFTTTVSCIDQRLSYLNPGDRNAAGDVLPDPCVGVTCGGHGSCVAMNMTATCACERGYVAQPVVDSTTGTRSASCVLPSQPIPGAFYNRRPGARDPSLPLGRPLEMEPPTAVSDPADPLPQNNADAMAAAPSSGGGGCSAGQRAGTGGSAALFGLLGVGLWLARSRRRAQRS